jgi:hypothetical protein
VVLGIPLAGCYTLEPVRGVTPVVGSKVAFDVNDAGRVALGGSMGPSILQIEGRLLDKDSEKYVVAVSDVHFLQGGQEAWTGEKVSISSQYVTSIYERRFSATRTAVVGAAAVGAIAAIVGRSLIGSGDGEQPKMPGDTGIALRRPRRP